MIEAGRMDSFESVEAFFQSLELPDIYGRQRDKQDDVKEVEITAEQYNRWTNSNSREPKVWAERIAFAKANGMRDVSSFTGKLMDVGSRRYFMKESPFEQQLTYWAPHQAERKAILSLARALNPEVEKPVILDVGAYNYFLTQLLAYDNQANIVGLEQYAPALSDNRITISSRSAHLVNGDLWDMLYSFGPRFSMDVHQRRRELLERVRDRQKEEQIFHNLADDGNFQYGDPLLLNGEVAELQGLVASRLSDSPVDIAICSMMTRSMDLTVPIRDGIYPKAIIYVRLTDGLTGAGDFYLDDDTIARVVRINKNTVISHNPGYNYSLLARWPTHWEGDWNVFDCRLRGMSAEVIVQVRNDIVLGEFPQVQVTQFPFDREIEKENTRSSDGEARWNSFLGIVGVALTKATNI